MVGYCTSLFPSKYFIWCVLGSWASNSYGKKILLTSFEFVKTSCQVFLFLFEAV